MMVVRISRLRDCGIFRDFTWPADLANFGRYNLIYGWNWTGKTTLSRLFRDLELRRSPTMGQAVLRIDGGDVHNADFPQSTLQIRVFNRDFIQESVFPAGGGDVSPIFVVGKESVEKQKEADRLKAECGTKESELNAARARERQAERDLDKHCIDRAKVIKDTLRLSGSAYNEFDKRDYQGRAQQMASDGNAAAHRLGNSQRDSFLAQHRSTPKPKVTEIAYGLPQLQELADGVSVLLGTTVVSASIQALKDDAALSEWTRHGLGLHKERNSDKCLFCEQPLPADRLANLEAHFNAEYDRFLRRIAEQTQTLESARKQASDLRLPDRAAFFDDLATEYDAAEQELRQALDVVQTFLGDLTKALNGKKAELFEASALAVSIPEVDAAVVERLNQVIRKHNQACDDFSRRVSEARDRLALDMIAESLDEFVRLRDAVQTATTTIGPIQNKVAQLTDQITQLERDIREHQQPAEELNEDLKRYLGHGELQLTIKDTGYSITRNGVPADMLSEGEMTAIALLYFLKSLEDRGFDKANGVVVLDDPVSSLDTNAIYLAFSLIRERTLNARQLFVFTHNFAFFRQVRNWLRYVPGQRGSNPGRRPSQFYMLECVQNDGQRAAALRPLDPLLHKYESEYHYLFACVYRAAKPPAPDNLEACYHMPNIARRLLESFLAFRHPDAFDNLWGALRGVTTSDEARKGRILNFVQTHSHGPGIGQVEHDPSILGECQPILQDILRLIEAEDASHYAAMKNLVDPSENGEGEA
jgi:wobble nucleotide-excising tRNase